MDLVRGAPGAAGSRLAATLGERAGAPAFALDGVRVVAGALLVRHFVEHLQLTPRLVGAEGIWHPSPLGEASGLVDLSRRLGELSTPALHAWFGAGAVLAGMVALGLWPRWCAGLLFLGTVITCRALPPVTSPDDAFARLVALWLSLFPVGRALAILPARQGPAPGARVAGLAAALLALVIHVEIGASIRALGLAPVTALASAVAVASLVAPGRLWRALGVAPAAFSAWQLHRAGGADVTAGVLLACHALPVLDRRGAERAASDSAPFDGLVALAVIVLALYPLQRLASAARLTSVAGAGAAVLTQVGLAPAAWRAAGRSEIVFEHARPEGGSRGSEAGADTEGVRMQLLLAALGAPSAPEPMRLTAARGLVARHCRSEPEEHAPGELRVGAEGHPRAVAWFDCGDGSTPPRVVLLGAPDPQSLPATRPVEQHTM